MARPWFRLYRKIVESKKVHDLPPALFKPWVMLLACTDDDGHLPSMEKLAFKLRVPQPKVSSAITTLAGLRFFDETVGGFAAHDWTDHNFDSDVSTDRVKRFRQQKCNALDTEEDTDTEEKQQARTRLPDGFIVSPEWISDGQKARENASLQPIDLQFEATSFVDYFTGPDCEKPLKKDWHRTWLRWCRYAKGKPNGVGPRKGGTGPLTGLAEKARAARKGH